MARRWHHAVLTASALLPLAVASAFAGPNGASVVGGAATVQGQGTANVTVNQSTQNAIINWQTFNIGSGEATKIYMPNSSSTQLDRVTGGQGPSQILGTLSSNGKVFLVNPDGILFGMGARINVGSLVASTNNIANSDFMAGRYNFSIPGNPNASIVNLGTITAQTGGFAALVAPGVRNTGTIVARLGTIALASGNAFTLDMYGDNLITLGLTDKVASQVVDVATGKPLKSLVANEGKLKANGGTVVLTAVAARKIVDSVINNSGVIEANTIGSHNGKIVLGGPTGTSKYARARKPMVKVSGTLSAAGKRNGTTGGTIEITGQNIQVAGATINASGQAGGGTVLIGGDWGGGHPNTSLVANASAYLENYSVPTATSVSIDAATMIDASATNTGNGGKVIVWANQATTFLGTILAKGGAQSGNGGFVETSGETLTFNGTVNTSALNGKTGTWLVDPTDLTIDATAASTIDTNLATTNVTLVTNADGTTSGPGTTSSGPGDIIVASGLSWSSGHTLTLDAYHAVTVNAPITVTGAGGLILDAASDPSAPAAPLISFGNNASVQFIGTPNSGQSLTINGHAYTLLYSMGGVQNINNNLSGNYALALPLDASGVSSWTPIGTNGSGGILNSGNGFNSAFQGLGNSISNLTINAAANYVGLFGFVGSTGLVQNIGLIGGRVSGSALGSDVGGLIGESNGVIASSYTTGGVGGASNVGGLVGFNNSGAVINSYATGTVGASISNGGGLSNAGGLIGFNGSGAVNNSYATGAVVGYSAAGGLIGTNSGSVNNSSATGAVVGQFETGGLIGANSGAVTNSNATGAVNSVSEVGGLIGTNSGSVNNSSATGTVSGSYGVGGLVGINDSGASVTRSFAAGAVIGTSGSEVAGGLIGVNDGAVDNSYATGPVTVGANSSIAGGLVGENNSVCCSTNYAASITNSYAAGAVTVGSGTAGGLVGSNFSGGSITNSYATGAVTVGNSGTAGGLVGVSNGCCDGNTSGITSITSSYATGAVTVGSGTAGGLVGEYECCNGSGGSITNSYATGNVTAGSAGAANGTSGTAGGLVGSASVGLSITQSYATGNVNVNVGDTSTNAFVDAYAGGLVGSNDCCGSGASITNSYATGAVSITVANTNTNASGCCYGGSAYAGGLVGYNYGNSISNSYATGAVNVSSTGPNNNAFVDAYAGGLVGSNGCCASGASITSSYATGAVSVTVANTNTDASGCCYGGSADAGGLVGDNYGSSIANSYATGAVTVSIGGPNNNTFVDAYAGGLVGSNGGVITNSQAYGSVTSTANLALNNNNNCDSGCAFVNVGGFVGVNFGTITTSGTPWTTTPATTPTTCTASFTCAGGNVSVGSLGSGAGFAGTNYGTISFAFATGNVTGAAGLGGSNGGQFDNNTQIAGFVAENQGLISQSFATGAVGTAGIASLSATGFVGDNAGTINSSFATGAVSAGDNSVAGGFAGSNSPNSSLIDCPFCLPFPFINAASISNSQAYGNVTVGTLSIAGGFAASGGDNLGGGTFTNISAFGAVNTGHDSIAGGLVGALLLDGTITNSAAQNTRVASSGANSIVGGVAGLNEGAISNTTSTAPVSGTSDSYIGGITGINLGSVTGSSTDPTITGSGGNNFIGGIAGLNAGSISNSTASAVLSSGPSSYVGGVAGVNGNYSSTSGTILNSSFPNGTIANSSATGTGFSSQSGTSTPATTPALPSWLSNCPDPACTFLTGGPLQPDTNIVPPEIAFANQQVLEFTQPINFTTTNITPPLIDPTTLTAVTGGPGGNPGNGPGGPGANAANGNTNTGNSGTLANGRQGGNGAPPGVRLIDMRVMPLPPGTGLPPPGETRFLPNQVVLQFGAGMTPQQIAAVARRFGLTIVSQQTVGAFGRTVYTVQINNGRSVADVIRAVGNAGLNAAAQPNYTYGLTQDQADAVADVGDPAQYIVQKLQLGAVHRITEGNDVVVALIDSRVDTKQPDFAGRIVDTYDAGCGPDTPPDAHGTGMAGAIASHIGLLGVAPSAKIIAICAFGGKGSPEATSAKIITGLDYAIAHGAKIINMSFAGPRDPALAQELQIAREKGILIVAAAGNAGPKSPPLYPGADPNVMAVTATDEHDRLFTGANQGSYVAVAAPGVNVLVPAPNGDVQFTTGTSVASANVSGVAALLMAKQPSRTPEDIRSILVSTAKHLGPNGMNPQFGAGLVDPLKALRFVPTALGGKSAATGSPLQPH